MSLKQLTWSITIIAYYCIKLHKVGIVALKYPVALALGTHGPGTDSFDLQNVNVINPRRMRERGLQ